MFIIFRRNTRNYAAYTACLGNSKRERSYILSNGEQIPARAIVAVTKSEADIARYAARLV